MNISRSSLGQKVFNKTKITIIIINLHETYFFENIDFQFDFLFFVLQKHNIEKHKINTVKYQI